MPLSDNEYADLLERLRHDLSPKPEFAEELPDITSVAEFTEVYVSSGDHYKVFIAVAGKWYRTGSEDLEGDIIDVETGEGMDTEFYLEVAKGNVPGHSIIHKFGTGDVGTSIVPITQSGFYRTPTSAVALEILSDNANDTIAGTGARTVYFDGIDADWNRVTMTVDMDGLTPVPIPTDLVRLHRWYIEESGTYATQIGGSSAGILTVREVTGGAIWSIIGITPFAFGQSQIGCTTILKGYTGYLLSKNVFTDSAKVADIYFFKRENADVVSAPFAPMKLVEREVGVTGGYDLSTTVPKTGFVGPCDVGFMGKVNVGTATISVEFEILLVQDGF